MREIASTKVRRAAGVLRAGGLVAFPTETVYGLGADARNADAVADIFAVKRRPATNPVICHVADVAGARAIVSDWPDMAGKLAERFWPGPLTLVLPKADDIPQIVTAGRPSVGVRVPAHPLALSLLAEFAGPIAAPSANRSSRISPTSADHVRQELGEEVDILVDGGPCAVGIESTVLSLLEDGPTILRPGTVTRAAIEQVIGKVAVASKQLGDKQPALSPGQQAVHYAPVTPTYRYEAAESSAAMALMARTPGAIIIDLPQTPAICATQLYSILRDADARGASTILLQMPPDEPPWAAVRDRLTRAARPLPME